MNKSYILWKPKVCIAALAGSLILAACLGPSPSIAQTPSPVNPSPTLSPAIIYSDSPTMSASPTILSSQAPTQTVFPDPNLPVWQHYAGPMQTAITAIPYPLTGLNMPTQVKVGLLAGVDAASPFVGRTDAILLVFYNPGNAHTSLVMIPPDLLVYIPGQTMQRLNIAYALGGIVLLNTTLEYNLGVSPSSWGIFFTDSFGRMIDAMGGINVNVPAGVWDACGGIPIGNIRMDGQTALCYVRLRRLSDEADRNRRELEVVQQTFLKMATSGNLAHLAALYNSIQPIVQSNVTLNDLAVLVPLALDLGEPSRIASFYLDEEQVKNWTVPGPVEAQVVLPRRSEMRSLLQHAIDFVVAPAPESGLAQTQAVLITRSPTITLTLTPTETPWPTITRTPTPTKTRTRRPG